MESYQRNPLGKGLSSLIPSTIKSEKAGDIAVEYIDIDDIHPNPDQPRKTFSPQEIEELSSSIKEHGLLQPILVKKNQGPGYLLIAGERRWQACKKLMLAQVPVIIKNIAENEILAISLIENIQRENLSPLEEAAAYKALTEEYNYTQEDLSIKLSKSRSHIANSLRLLNLPSEVKAMLNDKKLSAGHAKTLLNTSNPVAAAKHIADNNMSVRQAESYTRGLEKKLYYNTPSIRTFEDNDSTRRVSHFAKLHANNKADYEFRKDQDIIDIETNLSEALSCKVQIVERSFGGQIVIDFYNLDQLDSVISQLSTKKSWL